MNRHPPGYGFGMVVSMLAGMAIAGGIWHIGGGSFGILTFLVGLVIAPLIWALLRPLFLVLGALPGYLRSPIRREFRAAWKSVDHARLLQDRELQSLWRRIGRIGAGDKAYLWLKEEWAMDFAVSGASAKSWLSELVAASTQGRVREFWQSRPDTSEVRSLKDMYVARRVSEFMHDDADDG